MTRSRDIPLPLVPVQAPKRLPPVRVRQPGRSDNGRGAVSTAVRAYGLVVESVKVSVFEYEPVRSGSLAPIDCRKSIATASLLTGPV